MGTGGGGTTTIRYAPYIEVQHMDFLLKVRAAVDASLGHSPFAGTEELDVDTAFFGAGYGLASYPSLYDMYGKFMAGLNVEAVWSELFAATLYGPEVETLVQKESALMQDELTSNILPKYHAGMRDLNAVNSSSFAIGKALLYDSKQKSVEKFAAELRYKLITLAHARWETHLKWNSDVINTYMAVIKHYYAIKEAMVEMGYKFKEKDALWDFEVLDNERTALGALQGATRSKKEGPGKAMGALGGALSGASAGAMVGGGYGAVIGGVIGGIAGLLTSD